MTARRVVVLLASLAIPAIALIAVLATPVLPRSGQYPIVALTPLQPRPPGATLDQPFTPQDHDLSAIGLSLATYTGRSAGSVEISLLNSEGATLRRLSRNVADFRDVLFTRVTFTPIADSKGQTYDLRLRFEGAEGPLPATVMTTPATPGASALRIDGSPTDQVMPVHTWYGAAEPLLFALPTILTRASQYKPGILKVPWLWLWLALMVLLTGTLLVLTAIRADARSDG